MAVIDSLIVKFGLDGSGFKAGAKEASADLRKLKKEAAEAKKAEQEAAKARQEAFEKARGAAVRFFAILTLGAGATGFTKYIVNTGAQLDRMSKNLGTSADRLSRWQGAVRISGGTAEGALNSFQSLNASLTELKLTGNTGILPYLQALGVSLSDASGKARPLEDILLDIGDSLKKVPNREDAYNIGRNLGLDEGTVNLLMRSRAEISKMLAEQKGFSDADAKAAREAQENWERTKIEIERTTQTIVIAALPALKQIAESFQKIAEVATPVLKGAVDGFNDINEATNGWLLTLGMVAVALKAAIGLLNIFTTKSAEAGGKRSLSGLGRLGALGAAGAGGYAVGGWINKNYIEGTETGDRIGRTVAQVLAFFGNKEAQEAIDINEGRKPPAPTPSPSSTAPSMPSAKGAPTPTLPSAPPSGEKLSRAERNFNPGNLNYAGQKGATLESGPNARFARFQTMQEGIAALVKQLQRYGARGLDTIEKIINTYAPSSENNAGAYINRLAKDLGIGASTKLNLNDPNTMAGLVKGIAAHEAGRSYLSDQQIWSGLQMAGLGGGGNSTITIGKVEVVTQATDAQGIARDMHGALIRQADVGMR